MLPDIGASELLVIAVIALIVVGPKDLPALLRKLGQFMAKLRGMAAEFRASFDEMARQSELDELRKEVEAMRRGEFLTDPGGVQISQAAREIEQSLGDIGVNFAPPMGEAHAELQAAQEAEEAAGAKTPKAARTRKAPAKKAGVSTAKKTAAARKSRAKKIVEG